MEKKVVVPELVVMRAVASLSVVLLHTLSMVLQHHSNLTPASRQVMTIASLMLLFATPTFAFMSAFLIGFSKRRGSPGAVLWKRVKYLLGPFLFFSVWYAVWGSYNWGFPFMERLVYNLRGGYHGYFVLVVLQFYVAHQLLEPLLVKLPKRVILAGAGLINVAYLAALNLNWFSFPSYGVSWYHLFPAWCFYYVLGFYAGRNRTAFLAALRRRFPWGVALLVGSALTFLYVTMSGLLPHATSQRFDLVPYVTGVIWVFFPLIARVRRVPLLLSVINRASFGIYLLHWFFLELFWRTANHYLAVTPAWTVFGLFTASVVCSVALTHILNVRPWGAYLIGKLGVSARPQPRHPSSGTSVGVAPTNG